MSSFVIFRCYYIIYPVIEENQDQDLKSLKVMYGKLKRRFSGSNLAMFHGKMRNEEKLKVISDFRAKKIDILHKSGKIEDIVKASDQLNLKALSKPVTKYYICYPK